VRYNISIDKIEAVANKTGSVIFALLYKNHGREPYNEYFFLIKRKIHFITAETFWDVNKIENTNYLMQDFTLMMTQEVINSLLMNLFKKQLLNCLV